MSRNRVSAILSIVIVTLALALAAIGVTSATGPDPAPLTQALQRTCTTDASGYCTVTHTLGVVPEAAVVTPVISVGWLDYHLSVVAGSLTATSVRVRAMRTDTSPRASLPITFSLVVYGSAPAPTTTVPPTTTTAVPTTTPPVTTTTTPPPGGFPDASNTGVPAGTTLEVVNGDVTITTANDTVDAKDIRGCVEVRAPGVTISRSRISCDSFLAIAYFDTGTTPAAPLTIRDSEIDCRDTTGRTAIGEANIVALRVNVHGCENGFDANQHVTVKDSYIHDLANSAVAHTDGIQFAHYLNGSTEVNHARDITVDHNTIYANAGTSSVISNPSGDEDILVQNNLLAGGAYSLYCDYNGTASNYRVLNNHFSTLFYPTVGAFGPWTGCEDEAQVSGNVYHDGPQKDQPVPF
jgi:hypothetical protein